MKESELVNQILEYLLWQGVYCWRTNNFPVFNSKTNIYRAMPKHSINGVADILGITRSGIFFAIECKVGKNVQSNYQAEFGLKIKENKGIYLLAYELKDVESQIHYLLGGK